MRTSDKSKVDIPKWASSIEVGDVISFYNPNTDTVEALTVQGFSTADENMGLPVIEPPTGIDHIEIAVTEEYYVE